MSRFLLAALSMISIVARAQDQSAKKAERVMGMAIEAADDTGAAIKVVTTGAEFTFNREAGTIECSQRIPVARKVAVISGVTLKGAILLERNTGDCKIRLVGVKDPLVVSRDSMLLLPHGAAAALEISGLYEPKHVSNDGTNFTLPDEIGGVGCYIVDDAKFEIPANWKAGWKLKYTFAKPSRTLISVFPPKPFDADQARQTVLHSFSSNHPYPSDVELEQWSKFGRVLILHAWIWQGKSGKEFGMEQDDSWTTPKFEPKSEEEFLRVVKTAHKFKIKVLPYMSPLFSGGMGNDAFVKRVDEIMTKYGCDGVYFDELPHDIVRGYSVVRQVREMIGNDKILFIHASSTPFGVAPCPSIECYANYTYRGEHHRLDADYMRWLVSGFNLSNSVGTLVYDGCRVDKAVIDTALKAHVRLPFWVQDGTWNTAKYYLTEEEQKMMFKYYFPALASEK